MLASSFLSYALKCGHAPPPYTVTFVVEAVGDCVVVGLHLVALALSSVVLQLLVGLEVLGAAWEKGGGMYVSGTGTWSTTVLILID